MYNYISIIKKISYASTVIFILFCIPPVVVAIDDFTAEQLEKRLIASGWKREIAARVIELNRTYLTILEEENPEKLDTTIALLERLGKHAGLMTKIKDYPELAGLLAGADNPWEIANSFPEADCYNNVTGFYQQLADPAEQRNLADALNRHGRIICELANYGVPMPAAIFMFDHRQPGAKEYAAWLEQVVQYALLSSTPMTPLSAEQTGADELEVSMDLKERTISNNLAVTIAIINDQGPNYLERMKTDLQFRNKFRQHLWPAYVRLTDCSKKPEGECDTPLDIMISEPRVWDLLLHEDGEILFERWGLLAVELLVDDPNGDSFPGELRSAAREAMLSGDNAALSTLIRPIMRDEPLFRQLILRDDLDPGLREQVLADLAKTCPEEADQCPGLAVRLRQLLGYSPATLREDLGPPPSGVQTWLPLYSTYYLTKKILTDRPVDAMDIFLASTDVLFLATMTMGPATKALKPAATTVAKEVASKTAQNAAKIIAKDQIKITLASSLEKLALQGRLPVAVAKHPLKKIIIRTQKINKVIGKSLDIDVTPVARWAFQKTGIGRETMKKLTRLEARIFMRQNGRVVINPTNSRILGEIAENALGETVSETEAAQQVVKQAYLKWLAAKGSLEAWRQHASSWWLANATGSF